MVQQTLYQKKENLQAHLYTHLALMSEAIELKTFNMDSRQQNSRLCGMAIY